MLSNICAGTPQQIQHVFNLRLLTLVLQLQHNASTTHISKECNFFSNQFGLNKLFMELCR